MKHISVYVPESAVIEAITPAYRLFKTANNFLEASGKDPIFKVEYVGLTKEVSANDGEYIVKTDRLVKDIQQTDVIIIPALYGNIEEAIKKNEPAIRWIQKNVLPGNRGGQPLHWCFFIRRYWFG